MEIYMNTIFPLIGATLMVSAAGFAYELVSRKYKQLKELSQSGESIFMWVSKGWPILAALLNINFGILLFLTAIIFALRLYDMAVIPSVWLELLVTIWFIMMFSIGYSVSREKRWKLF